MQPVKRAVAYMAEQRRLSIGNSHLDARWTPRLPVRRQMYVAFVRHRRTSDVREICTPVVRRLYVTVRSSGVRLAYVFDVCQLYAMCTPGVRGCTGVHRAQVYARTSSTTPCCTTRAQSPQVHRRSHPRPAHATCSTACAVCSPIGVCAGSDRATSRSSSQQREHKRSIRRCGALIRSCKRRQFPDLAMNDADALHDQLGHGDQTADRH